MRGQDDPYIPARLVYSNGKILVSDSQYIDREAYMRRPDIIALYAEADRLTRKLKA